MAKLADRRKVTVMIFRRSNPDEIFLMERQVKGKRQWSPPSVEARPGESLSDAAQRAVAEVAGTAPTLLVDLEYAQSYRVKSGPSAGEWTESFFGAELPVEADRVPGVWRIHYEAKAEAQAVKVRDAITRLRAKADLKP